MMSGTARAARDALIPEWERALSRLKDSTKVAVRDVVGRQQALFAEPDTVQIQVRPKAKKAKKATKAKADSALDEASVTGVPTKRSRRQG